VGAPFLGLDQIRGFHPHTLTSAGARGRVPSQSRETARAESTKGRLKKVGGVF